MWDMKKYSHLSEQERELIFLYLSQGKSLRTIAKLTGRNHRTIAREVNRNSGKDGNLEQGYFPSQAQGLATQRRNLAKVGNHKLDDLVVKRWVISKLGRGWSPEQIAGRLKLKTPRLVVSHETIYQFIYAQESRRLKLWDLLRKRHPKRQPHYGRRCQRLQIPGRIFIEKRPEEANQRLKVGHWETDNMEGPRNTSACTSVTVERKSLLTKMIKLDSKQASDKEKALISQFDKLPEALVKTITYDNGSENHNHRQVADKLHCQSYFCHAYHSWEKGTVENTIGLVREYLPKGTDLGKISQGELSWIAWQLNNRPRKKLDYYTPSEIFYKETGWVT